MDVFCGLGELNLLVSQKRDITSVTKGPELCLGMGGGCEGATSLLAMSCYISAAMLQNTLVAAARHIAALTAAAT